MCTLCQIEMMKFLQYLKDMWYAIIDSIVELCNVPDFKLFTQ
jgi:hypothetical protein